jgi:hypothetical protein
MRRLSSTAHLVVISPTDHGRVRIDDSELPAARHLVGPGAVDVLRLPVEAAGGELLSAQPEQVQYRPGSDVVVRYSAQVAWNGQPARRETLAASSTIHGSHPGTIGVTATTPDGPLDVGVWRWPFDPVLVGLPQVVSPSSVAEVLRSVHGPLDPHAIRLDVVAYRPTDRAVIRVDVAGRDTVAYLKIVDPRTAPAIAERHRRLLDAGVPVPRVDALDTTLGLIVLAPLVGPTLRELIKSDTDGWPPCSEFDRLAEGFSAAPLETAANVSRLTDGALHARMLATVMPSTAVRLGELAEHFESTTAPLPDTVIHGDLHEAQIIVDQSSIVGVLDIDDAGPGLAVDDRANVLARLAYRATTDPVCSANIRAYADRLRADSLARFDPVTLGLHTAAALTGLATGPFRLQSQGWSDTVVALLDVVDELCMRELSATTHVHLT